MKPFRKFLAESPEPTPAECMRLANHMTSADILKLAILCLKQIGDGRSSYDKNRIAQALGLIAPLVKKSNVVLSAGNTKY
jgi:hypothetical protein